MLDDAEIVDGFEDPIQTWSAIPLQPSPSLCAGPGETKPALRY